MPIKDNSVYRLMLEQCYRGDTKTYRQVGPRKLLVRNRDGVSNPNWKRQIRAEQNAATNMTGNYDVLRTQRIEASMQHTHLLDPQDKTLYTSTLLSDGHANLLFIGDIPGFNTAEANNRALVAFRKRASNVISPFKGLTFAGELRESIGMIRRPGKALRELADRWIRNNKKRRSINGRQFQRGSPEDLNWRRNLSKTWLEQAFGWTPLLDEIQKGWKLYRSARDERTHIRISAIGIHEKLLSVETSTIYADASTGLFPFLVTYRKREKGLVKYSGIVIRDLSCSTLDRLAPWGFNPMEFIPTAWELLPWSFLIDYFSNIGDVITAGASGSIKLAWVNRTIIQYITHDNSARINKGLLIAQMRSYQESANFATLERRKVTRQANVVLEYPTISFEVPSLPAQWANIGALFGAANDVSRQRMPKTKRGLHF